MIGIPPVALLAGVITVFYTVLSLPLCVLVGRFLRRNQPKELSHMILVYGPILGVALLLLICGLVVRANDRAVARAQASRYWFPSESPTDPAVTLSAARECGPDGAR